MHGEKGRADLRDALDALAHGVADVVQLEIEKYLLADAISSRAKSRPAGKAELIADLVERHGIAEPRDQASAAADRRQIERNDQALARISDTILLIAIIRAISTSRASSQPKRVGDCAFVLRDCPSRRRPAPPAAPRPARESPARRSRAPAPAAAPAAIASRRARPDDAARSRTRGPCKRRERRSPRSRTRDTQSMRVLQERRDGRVVFRARDEDALMRRHHPLQLDRALRAVRTCFEIGVVDRHRIVVRAKCASSSASSSVNSFAASAASRALCEPVRTSRQRREFSGDGMGSELRCHGPGLSAAR